MAHRTRRGAALVAAIAAAMMLALTGTAFAWGGGNEGGSGSNCRFGSASGDGTTMAPGTGTVINRFKWNVCRTGPKPTDVTGYFQAVTPSGPGQMPAPQGPLACAEFSGKKVSFLYTLNEKTRPPQFEGTQILIAAVDGGAADKQGFTGPLPPAAFQGCGFATPQSAAAFATAVPARGITVTSPTATGAAGVG